jgi:molybdenum cofactor cytidylyltransferase
MRFERIAVADALGAMAGHTVSHGDGVVKKGTVFDAQAIEALEKAGVGHVYAVRFDDGDVSENEAARALAEALCGTQAEVEALATGRANLKARGPGMARIDAAGITRLNRIYEGVTVATVPPFEQVEAGQRLATVKIIPFAVEGKVFERALAIARECDPLIGVAPFARKRVGLVLTRVPRTKAAQLEKSERVITERVEALGSKVTAVRTADHETAAVAQAVRALMEADPELGLVLVFGGAAIADRNDVVPAGLAGAGGTVSHLGMPVEPGNLLMLGGIGAVPVIGAPSCARSPKLNGFDWVLQRLLADQKVAPDDIMGMCVGGLLI